MSKAAAVRWFESHVGEELTTVQTNPHRGSWVPGPRVLSRKGKVIFALNDSRVNISEYNSAEVVDDKCILVWFDRDGGLIHTTVYSVCERSSNGTDG